MFPVLANVTITAEHWATLLDGATTAEHGRTITSPVEQIFLNWNDPAAWPTQTEVLTWCGQMNAATAAVMLLVGLVFLLFGYASFRWLVTLNAAVVGGWVGAMIGRQIDGAAAGVIVGALLFGGLAWPMFKVAVAVTGGVLGLGVGLSLWRSVGLDPRFCVAGGAIGGVFFGMLSFVSFKPSVMVFTSLQGAAMVVVGLLGLMYKYSTLAVSLDERFSIWPAMLPLAIFVPTLLGSIYQITMSKPAPVAEKKKD